MNRPVPHWCFQFVVEIFIVIFGVSPLIPVAVAAAIANVAGCTLSESAVSACPIAGIDFGGILNALGTLGWFGLFTFPCAGILVVCWLVWVLVTLVKAS